MQDKRSGLQAHVEKREKGQIIIPSTLNQQLQCCSNQNTKVMTKLVWLTT